MAVTLTVAAPSKTTDVTSQVLAMMAALSGVVTDYNKGSTVRTQAEAFGAVVERQGIQVQATVLQAAVYSALSLFDVPPGVATYASGSVNINTAPDPATGPPATANVPIPSGTIVGTAGGIQYQTSGAVLLTAGSSGVSVPIVAMTAGLTGNVAASGVSQLISTLSYPLFPVNPNPIAGGNNAGTYLQALAQFAAKVRSIGLASPGSLASAAYGVMASGTSETVLYATCYEPWIAAGSGVGSGVAGYSIYIDNGTGTASSGLIAAVTSFLNGGMASGATNAGAAQGVGFRPAGIPYNIYAVTPTVANVSVSGVVSKLTTVSAVQAAFQQSISGYFTLPFGAPAIQAILATTIGNSAAGLMTSLTVNLTASGSTTPVSGIGCLPYGRVILGTLSLSLFQGT